MGRGEVVEKHRTGRKGEGVMGKRAERKGMVVDEMQEEREMVKGHRGGKKTQCKIPERNEHWT